VDVEHMLPPGWDDEKVSQPQFKKKKSLIQLLRKRQTDPRMKFKVRRHPGLPPIPTEGGRKRRLKGGSPAELGFVPEHRIKIGPYKRPLTKF
jgi:hypothetical protein